MKSNQLCDKQDPDLSGAFLLQVHTYTYIEHLFTGDFTHVRWSSFQGALVSCKDVPCTRMDAEPSTSVDDPPPNHERSQLLPSLAVDNGSLRIKPPAQPRSLSRQSQNSDETTFWDSQTTAAQSPPFSPYAEPPSSASRALSESSFTTATPQLSQDNSPAEIPDVGVTSPTPVPTRLESERQRWLLSRGGRADSFPPSTPTSLHNSRDGPASEPGSTTDKRGPASRSSHGIETSSGPPPALLNRKSQTKDSIRRSPTSRIVSQRGLQPLRLVSQRGGPLNRQRSDTTVRPNNAQPSSDLKSPTSASSPADGLLSPRSLSLARSMDGRPTSSGRLMRRTAPAEYFEGIGAISGEDESPGNVESGTEGQSSEDVFLNLAQDTPQKDSGVGLERRRVSAIPPIF